MCLVCIGGARTTVRLRADHLAIDGFADASRIILVALLVEGLAALGLVVPPLWRTVDRRRWPYALLAVTYAVGLAWLVVYAAGDDSYFAPDEVSRWEYAARNDRSTAVALAAVVTLAGVVVLAIAATSARHSRLRRLVVPSAVLAPFSIVVAAFVLSVGH